MKTLKPAPARLAQQDMCDIAVLVDGADYECLLVIDEGDYDDDECMDTES